jgi:hypothetical protein
MDDKKRLRKLKVTDFRSQWQVARRFIYSQAFFDRLKGELVCLTESNEVADYLALVFEHTNLEDIPRVECGLILADSRGEGAFQ